MIGAVPQAGMISDSVYDDCTRNRNEQNTRDVA
jgi:hypothetical protein